MDLEVRLLAEAENEVTLRIEVQDTGIGIPKTACPKSSRVLPKLKGATAGGTEARGWTGNLSEPRRTLGRPDRR